MTQPYLGMDPEQVRLLAAQLTAGATQVRDLTTGITGQIETTQWTGADREAFVTDWQTNYVTHLTVVADGLDSAALRASANAEAQDTASAA